MLKKLTSSAQKSTASSAKKTSITNSKALTSTTSTPTVTAYKELESGKLGEDISYIIYSDGEIRYIPCALKNKRFDFFEPLFICELYNKIKFIVLSLFNDKCHLVKTY